MSRRSQYASNFAIPPRKGQASVTAYAGRLRNGTTSLLVPQGPLTSTGGTLPRAAKRTYAETDDDDFEGDKNDEGTIRSRPAVMTNHVYHTEDQLDYAAQQPEILIPIRINLDLGSNRLSDFFLWNLSEQLITPEHFSQIMCADLDISPHVFAPQISQAIRTQIEEYAPVATIDLPVGIQNVIVQLSLHLAKHLYEDKFEWDLTGSRLTPERFAKTIVQDLGLSGEFYPAIAHSIYEVLIRLKKEACEGHLPTDIDNDAAYGAEAGWRIDQEGLGNDWAPTLEELSQEEIERREVERERNIRRLRRETAKFGDGSDKSELSRIISGSKRRRRTMF
ncbi:hypothetical protein V1514DRAFT_37568 [Lipomyces japonicus]|uniref:uncharacterized protein n=1 Tax=Lipomyces japonicus TaxID=56871 RepID=UPI0034CF9F5B